MGAAIINITMGHKNGAKASIVYVSPWQLTGCLTYLQSAMPNV